MIFIKNNFRLVLLIVFLSNFNFAYGWGKIGHRTVARIAERHLTENAKKQIAQLLGNQSMVYWANYPDFIKSNPELRNKTSSWHYLDLPENLNRKDFEELLIQSSDENIYKRIQLLEEQLKNRKNYSNEEQVKALYFLIHLMGDLHQPLHVGREEDYGGNKIKISWFGVETNLHSLWDDELVDYQKYSYTEFANILDYHNEAFNREYASGSLEDWAFESYQQVAVIYYGVKNGDKLTYRYDYDHVNILEEQLLKAGLRLAKVLNDIFR